MADINSVVEVNVSLITAALTLDGFKRGFFVTGDSSVLGTGDNRFRVYQNFAEVEEDFAAGSTLFDAAEKWFGQSPLPKPLVMARLIVGDVAAIVFAASNTKTVLQFEALVATAKFDLVVDGETIIDVAPDFTAAGSFAGVAIAIKTAIDTATATAADVTVVFDAVSNKFSIQSGTTGVASTLTFMLPPTSGGTDLGDFMGFKEAAGAILNQGADDESGTLVIVQSILDIIAEYNVVVNEELSGGFTFLMNDYDVHDLLTVDNKLVLAQAIDDLTKIIYAVHDDDAAYQSSGNETVFGFRAKELLIERTFITYSITRDYKHVSASSAFSGSIDRTSLNLKELPLTLPDIFSFNDIESIKEKRANYYTQIATQAAYQNSFATKNGVFIDTWVDQVQVELELKENVFNFLQESSILNNDVPYTDEGSVSIQEVIERTMSDAVGRGVYAVGTADDAMKQDIIVITGDQNFSGILSKGYLVHRPAVSTATTTQRANRAYPKFTIWAISAGTIQSVQIDLNVLQ